MNKVEAIKLYMATPGKLVTNAELIKLRKEDFEGFDWMAEECAKALGSTID